jgi:hypothetical protein
MNTPLARVAPESVGISSEAIETFLLGTEKEVGGLHSFMLLRYGQVAAEAWWSPYAPERRHMLFSLSKSFASTAVGMAVTEGRLTVDDPVLSFFPEEAPRRVSANLAAMRVRHLLSMTHKDAKGTLDAMVVSARRGRQGPRLSVAPRGARPRSTTLFPTTSPARRTCSSAN